MATQANVKALVVLVGAIAVTVNGEASAPALGAAATLDPVASVKPGDFTVIREIDDPFTGDRWLFVRDPNRPGGPGRIVLAARGTETAGVQAKAKTESTRPVHTPRTLLIHSGDRVIVEGHSRKIDATLEAVALDDTSLGAPLRVRLRIGNRVLRATAVERGHAAL